jgi:hypothetical protein
MAIKIVSTSEANEVIEKVTRMAERFEYNNIFDVIKPVLDAKCPFTKLDRIGKILGDSAKSHPHKLYPLLEKIVAYNAMGGFVVVAQALVSLTDVDFENVMNLSREYIIRGATWYVCDIIGERSIGQALNKNFERTLPCLKSFLADSDNWVRRSAGVAIHLFVKRNKNSVANIKILLKSIEPHIEEKQIDVVKGIGWGLKTVGKHHPDLMADFLKLQATKKKRLSGVMFSKAVTYLGKTRRSAIERHIRSLSA